MKKAASISIIFILVLIFLPMNVGAQTKTLLETQVDDLVLKHYFSGIQYADANALGPNAVSYLLTLLNNPDLKEYWVNIIVTLGFIESSTALDPLISFLDTFEGEVDGHTFRALLSVPFAVGCIASNGDVKAHNYLVGKIYTPANTPVKWSYRGNDINRLLSEKSVIGLAVSGQSRARPELLKLKNEIDLKKGPPERERFIEHVKEGLKAMDRIKNEGRSKIFNP